MSERWTIDDLIRKDKLVNEKKSLKDLILEMEDEVLANAGVDVFVELFKLIFTKLHDEMEGGRDRKRHLVFNNYGDTETELKTKDEEWTDICGEGWKKLRKLRTSKDSNRDFGFDILMANPPFAGDIKETRILAKYELGKKDNGKYQSTVGRDILFIERNLNFLKPGGRMAVVLPQGRFNNCSDKQIREFIAGHCRILAVVGLYGNVFKPHTGTKTSVLFVQN